MNKVILSLLLAVCVLGMALIMLNEKLRKPEQAPITQATLSQGADAGADSPTVPDMGLPPLGDTGQAAKIGGPAEQPYLPPLPVESGHSPAPVDRAPQLESNPLRSADAASVHAPLPEPVKHKPEPASAADKGTNPSKPEAASPAKPAVPVAPAVPAAPAAPEKAKAPEKTAQEKPSNTEKAAKAAPQKQEITRFVVFARDKGATIRLVGTAPLNYKNMTLNSPERLVLDLEGKWQVKAPGVPKNPLVTNIRLGKMDDKTRVVIDLSGKPAHVRYVLSKDKLSLDIRVDQ